jgi:hypothetical protein
MIPQDAQKGRSARPQAKQEPEAYPLGYGEDSCELRTPLADFFSILLGFITICTIGGNHGNYVLPSGL